MQQVCTTQVGPSFFLRNYENKSIIRFENKKQHMMKHISSNQKRKKRKKIFSHYLVSVKNRNSPVTFTLHFLIIYIYVHGFILIICHCPLCLYQQFTKERKLQSNAYTLLERCA